MSSKLSSQPLKTLSKLFVTLSKTELNNSWHSITLAVVKRLQLRLEYPIMRKCRLQQRYTSHSLRVSLRGSTFRLSTLCQTQMRHAEGVARLTRVQRETNNVVSSNHTRVSTKSRRLGRSPVWANSMLRRCQMGQILKDGRP